MPFHEARPGVGPPAAASSPGGGWWNFLLFALIGLHGWPAIFRLPHTLRAVFRAFRPGGAGIPDREFWAFSHWDAGLRSWYNRNARDHERYGRFGYIWDDTFGTPAAARFFANLVTYKLLAWLGTRRLSGLGFLLMVGASAGAVGWAFGPWPGLAVGLLGAGSPLLVASYTHQAKTEVCWWGLAVPFLLLAFTGAGFRAGLLCGLFWSGLAFANLGISVLLPLLLGPALLAHALGAGMVGGLLVGTAPGLLKHGLRGWYAWRSGYLGTLVSEQARLWKRPWYPVGDDLVWWVPFAASVLASTAASGQWRVGTLLLAGVLGVHWANHRLIYLNDPMIYGLAFWAVGLGYAVVARSGWGLAAILFLAYTRPATCGVPAPASPPDDRVWRRRRRGAWRQIRAYPALAPLRFLQPAPVMAFFDHLPEGTRFLVETHADMRTASPFRIFWQWTDEFLPGRQVELANGMRTRLAIPELADRSLSRFNGEAMTGAQMRDLCGTLGAACVVAHTPATVEALQAVGFTPAARVDLAPLEEFRKILRHPPPVVLTLLRHPEPTTVIDPWVEWERRGNALTWSAAEGRSYLVRYRHHPYFAATQGGQPLPVEPVRPFPDLNLTFMRVTPPGPGPVELRFHCRFL